MGNINLARLFGGITGEKSPGASGPVFYNHEFIEPSIFMHRRLSISHYFRDAFAGSRRVTGTTVVACAIYPSYVFAVTIVGGDVIPVLDDLSVRVVFA